MSCCLAHFEQGAARWRWGLEKSMRFPESCSYCLAASEHKDLSTRDTYVCHTKSILTLHLFSKSKKNGTFTGRGARPPPPPQPPLIWAQDRQWGGERQRKAPGASWSWGTQARGHTAPSEPPFRGGQLGLTRAWRFFEKVTKPSA